VFTKPLTDRQRRELQRLAQLPDSKIDLSDAAESPSRLSGSIVGRFYRPIKQPVSLRVDADVLAWFKSRGEKYQTYINQVLRREMQSHTRAK
jgi:uncharacterized protein (DUF4415 family)